MTATTSDLLMGSFDSVEPVGLSAAGEIVRATDTAGRTELVLLPASLELADRECAILAEMAGPGVPTGVRVSDPVTGRVAILLGAPADCVPLAVRGDLPAAALRAGLVSILRVLHRAHARGRIHGAISRTSVFASSAGDFHLLDWSGATPVAESVPASERADGFSDVSADVRALGMAFGRALLRVDHTPAEAVTPLCYDALSGHAADPDFRRVLSRLLAPDPRDAYPSAGAVLLDLGEQDSLDPWLTVPFVPRHDIAGHLQSLLGVAPGGAPPLRERPGLVELVGVHGAGRTRELAWIAAVLRASGTIVLGAAARPAGWGGLEALARQLVHLLGRNSPAVQAHEESLQWLTAAEGVVTEARVVPATLALGALVAEAFGSSPGALLLDDADDLPRAAADVWYAVGRRLASPPEPPNRAVLVATTTRPRTEHDIPRERLTLGEWSAADVACFLEGTLHAPELAGDLALRLVELAGGLPADIVGVLRELESSGGLVRIGTRWRLDVPLHELADRASTGGEHVRSALMAAGRDAAELTELLAVAGGALSRERCSRLSALPGPRLWQAAERAEAAGLLLRDGTTWRLRSERIRRRVLSAIPDSNRRSLHREFLVLLREERPDDISEIARHARAAGHVDAAELTERAVSWLRDHGYFDTALRHLEDAESTLGEPDWGRTRRRERAALLLQAGRLGDAATVLRNVLADPTIDDSTRAEATLELVEVLYESRESDSLLAVEIPDTPTSAAAMAALRQIRASTYMRMLQVPQANRESRLAQAELGPHPTSARFMRAECEFMFQAALVAGDSAEMKRALIRKIRLATRSRRVHEHLSDLVRLGLLLDKSGNPTAAKRVFSRAAARLARVPEGLRHVRGAYLTGAAIASAMPHGASQFDYFGRGSGLYTDTGSTVLAVLAQLRHLLAKVWRRGHDGAIQDEIDRILASVRTASRDIVLIACFEVAQCVLLLGFHPIGEWLARALSGVVVTPRIAVARRDLFRARLLWSSEFALLDDDVSRTAIVAHLSRGVVSGDPVERCGQPAPVADHGVRNPSLLAAYSIRAGVNARSTWSLDWQDQELVGWIERDDIGIGELALALALGIWRSGRLGEAELAAVYRARQAFDGAWFPQLRWQARLLDAKRLWRSGRLRDSRDAINLAAADASWLRMQRYGEAGAKEYAFAIGTILRHGPPNIAAGKELPSACTSVATTSTPTPRSCVPGEGASPWSNVRALTRSAARGVIQVRRADRVREVVTQVFGAGADCVRPFGVMELQRATIIALPELLSTDEMRRAFEAVDLATTSGQRLFLITTRDSCASSLAPPMEQALLRSVAGVRVVVEEAPITGRRAVEAFLESARRVCPTAQVENSALAAIAATRWEGGIDEIDSVARALVDSCARVTADAVNNVRQLEERPSGSVPSCAVSAIMEALTNSGTISVRDVRAAVGLPRRTVQRYLASMATDGLLIREGRGRGVRYRIK